MLIETQVLYFFNGLMAILAAAAGSAGIIYMQTWTGYSTGCGGRPSGRVKKGTPKTWYDQLPKPKWLPPGWVFGVAWVLLYTALAFVAWGMARTDDQGSQNWRIAYGFFYAQLFAGVLWTVAFFVAQRVRLALAVLVLTLGLNVTGTVFLGLYPTVGTFTAVGNEWLLVALIAWCAYDGWLLLACFFNIAIVMALDRLAEKRRRGVEDAGSESGTDTDGSDGADGDVKTDGSASDHSTDTLPFNAAAATNTMVAMVAPAQVGAAANLGGRPKRF